MELEEEMCAFVTVRLNNTLYTPAIRPIVISNYGSKEQIAERQRKNTTEIRILRWILRKIRNDRIRNEMFWRAEMVKPITTYVTQSRITWHAHVMLKH